MSTSDNIDDLFSDDSGQIELSDYGKRFLERVPEEEKPYAEKYVKEWDAGVNKLRSKYDEELNTYKGFGPIEDIQAGNQLLKMLVDQPEEIAQWLAKEKGIYIAPPETPKIPSGKQPTGEPDPYEDRFSKLEQGLVMTAQQLRERDAQQQAAQARAEYEGMLREAEEKHGKFDWEYVTFLLANQKASTMDEAVEAYHRLVPGQRKQAPNLLGASGNAPINGGKKIDYGSLSEADVGRLIKHRLEQARDANG